MYFIMPPPTSIIRNATLRLGHVTLGQPPKIKLRPNRKLTHDPSVLIKEEVTLAFMKVALSTKPILSAPHLQGKIQYICSLPLTK